MNPATSSATAQITMGTKKTGQPPKICAFCEVSVKSLKNHLRSAHRNEAFECKLCSYISDKKTSYNQHLLSSKHTKNLKASEYKCKNCSYGGPSESALRQHIKSVHPQLTYQCVKCSYTTDVIDDLKMHYSNSHNDQVFQCAGCSFISFDAVALENHKKNCVTSKKGSYSCKLCSYSSRKKSNAGKHVIKTHCTDTNCIFCAYITDKKENLLQHITAKHIVKNNDSADENSLTSLIQTMKLTETVQSFQCPYCSFVASSKRKYKEHKKEHYSQCDYCDFRAPLECSMSQHLKSKHCFEDNKFSCNFCSFYSEDYSAFVAHLETIHGYYKCFFKACNFESQDLIYLAQHITDYHGWDKSGYTCNCGFHVDFSFSLGQHKRDKHDIKILSSNVHKCQSHRDFDTIFMTA